MSDKRKDKETIEDFPKDISKGTAGHAADVIRLPFSKSDEETPPGMSNMDVDETTEKKQKEPSDVEKKVQKNKNRCWNCRKKCGIFGVECKCGYVFCMNCRYPEAHSCSVDYATAGKEELAKANPVVSPAKLAAI